jgi:hypothetical protein
MTDNDKETLRADIATYMQSTQPNPEMVPLPAQANRAAMTPAQIEEAHSNWVDWIYARAPQTWQPDEIAAVRFTARRVIATL